MLLSMDLGWFIYIYIYIYIAQRIYHLNPLNAELSPICHLQALLGAHHILHVSRTRVKVGKGLSKWLHSK